MENITVVVTQTQEKNSMFHLRLLLGVIYIVRLENVVDSLDIATWLT